MDFATDVVVIGGGVVGSLIAYQLRKRGVQVAVLESGSMGAQASSAATGLLAPFKLLGKRDDSYLALQRASLALFPSLIAELEDMTGVVTEYHQTGTIRLASLKQLPQLEQWTAAWREEGVPMEILQKDRLEAYEPSLSPAYAAAVSIPVEPQVRAASFVKASLEAARRVGAVLVEHCRVIGVERSGSRVTGVRTVQGEMIGCSAVVVAAGAWSGECGGWLDIPLPVRPLQGQSILLHQPSVPVRHILFGAGVYLAPKMGDVLTIGATYDEVGFDCRVTSDGIAQLLDAARRLIPSLSEREVLQSWAGLRPRTPDGRPVLGPAPGWENVILACGHNGFGVLLSAITGQAIAELVVTGRMSELLHRFTLDRFSLTSAMTAA